MAKFVNYFREYVQKRNPVKSFYNLQYLHVHCIKLIDMRLRKVVGNVRKRN